ncbi:MAG: hypothetical protein M0R77_12830 [Gammaproteobacteria bacterium]|nr:hypothetical protein [Gammaproteobacteria bacterium]
MAFIDRFGVEINEGDLVAFACKEYSRDAMIGATVAFGTVKRYYPAGGMLIDTVDGREVRLMKIEPNQVVALNEDFMEMVKVARTVAIICA